MRTGQIPWVRMKVDIVAGEYRGQRGIVRDVNRYRYNPQNPGKVSGLDVTEFEKTHLFTGSWAPGACTPIINLDELTPSSYTSADNTSALTHGERRTAASDSGEEDGAASEFGVANATLTHWILHPNLLGIGIRANIQGGPYDTVQKKKKGGVFVKTVMQHGRIIPMVVDTKGQLCPVSVHQILKFSERPKPTSERSLMVVIEGPHTGKFVRQLYYYYRGGKVERNVAFIALVTTRTESRGIHSENVTTELLQLDHDEVELVEETADKQRSMNVSLKEIRDTYRTYLPQTKP